MRTDRGLYGPNIIFGICRQVRDVFMREGRKAHLLGQLFRRRALKADRLVHPGEAVTYRAGELGVQHEEVDHLAGIDGAVGASVGLQGRGGTEQGGPLDVVSLSSFDLSDRASIVSATEERINSSFLLIV